MDTALEAIVEFALAATTGEDLRLYDTARSTYKSSITPLRTKISCLHVLSACAAL